jgi:hypothetical protein
MLHTVVLTIRDRDTGERFDVTYPRVEAPTSWQAIDAAVALWRETDANLDTAGVVGRGRYTLVVDGP